MSALLLSLLLMPLAWWLPMLTAGPYILASLLVSLHQGWKTRSLKNALLLPITFASLHWVYGAGSVWGLMKLARIKLTQRKPAERLFPDTALEHEETL
jgi:hypothetical protein